MRHESKSVGRNAVTFGEMGRRSTDLASEKADSCGFRTHPHPRLAGATSARQRWRWQMRRESRGVGRNAVILGEMGRRSATDLASEKLTAVGFEPTPLRTGA